MKSPDPNDNCESTSNEDDLITVRGQAGFFCVGQATNGRWWLLDPDGQPFFYRGVCGVNRAGTQGGRRAKPGPYADAVDTKYATRERFVAATVERLRAWNFNAFGCWTTEEFFDRGLPYTEILDLGRVGPRIEAPGVVLPDVFDPAWQAAINEVARQLCTPRQQCRDLVGYFTDNELGWGQPQTDEIFGGAPGVNRAGQSLWEVCRALPAGRAAHLAAMEFPDNHSFSREFTHRYVRSSAEAIRRYDPNHLILGARFGAPPGAAVLAEFKPPWVDVVSANNYRRTMWERIDHYHQGQAMPVLIGEFAWASPPFTDRSHQTAAECALPVADVVRAAGTATLQRAAAHPALVGYTWYRWVQDPEPSGIGYGLVDTKDEPVQFNVELLTELNGRLDSIVR